MEAIANSIIVRFIDDEAEVSDSDEQEDEKGMKTTVLGMSGLPLVLRELRTRE